MDERLAFDVQIDRLLKKLRTKLGFFYRLNFFSIWGSKENSRVYSYLLLIMVIF